MLDDDLDNVDIIRRMLLLPCVVDPFNNEGRYSLVEDTRKNLHCNRTEEPITVTESYHELGKIDSLQIRGLQAWGIDGREIGMSYHDS